MASDRRDWMKQAGLGALGVSLLRTRAQAQGAVTGKTPKNIIYMVSDGMSAGVLALAELASQSLNRKPTAWAQLLRDDAVARGLFDQASLSSCVTDSAAASSSWGCGSRVANGAINTLPDGTPLTPIAKLAKEKGMRVGLVTTTAIWDATPAGFAASVPKRSLKDDIAQQYLGRVDVLMGGGREAFRAQTRADKVELLDAYRERGYAVYSAKAELGVPKPGAKLVALFRDGQLPYSIDHIRNPEAQAAIPTLAEMARVALAALREAPKGFLLQVEGARIDHAAHANDAAALIQDQLAFDAAVAAALEFARQDGETLVVLCTDHGNSNPGLNGMGGSYGTSDQCIARAVAAKASFTEIARQLGNRSDYTMDATKASDARATAVAKVTEVIRAAYGVELPGAHASAIARAAGGEKGIVLNAQQDTLVGVIGQVLANVTGVGFVGTSHTADYATSTAVGPGQEHFEGLLRNTDVFAKLTQLMGTPFKNPTAEARTQTAGLMADAEPAVWAV
jgi:alkaline phosphatase